MSQRNQNNGPQRAETELAWMGWALMMPAEWRPLKIRGEYNRGAVIVGDGEHAVFQIKWWRPGIKKFNSDDWISRRLEKEFKIVVRNANAPCPAGFTNAAWVLDAKNRGKGNLMVWYGYAAQSDLMIEIISGGDAPDHECRKVIRRTIPSLRMFRPDESVCYCLFNRKFKVPAGFVLKIWKLESGDITLKFETGKSRESLTVRQIYPADLALSRCSIDRWMLLKRFKENRKFVPVEKTGPYEVKIKGVKVSGARRYGRKKIPFPLGGVLPLESVFAGLHDVAGNRLIFIEYDVRKGNVKEKAEQIIMENLACAAGNNS